jgi:5-(carboxyamino)imidazole ribonucleotide mutase
MRIAAFMPNVLIILGSKSDAPVAAKATALLREFEVTYEIKVASAHRTPELVRDIVTTSDADVFIAIAGLSAALPGAVAAATTRPVIGVPVSGKVNLDSILSIVQMPSGVPVAAVGLDRGKDPRLAERLAQHRKDMAEAVRRDSEELSRDV